MVAAIRRRVRNSCLPPRYLQSGLDHVLDDPHRIGHQFRGAATLLGLFVGLVMVAQTLYASVLDRLAEFGTLKAIGATERQVFSILFLQVLSMSLAGSLIGLLLVGVIQRIYDTPQAPIVIPWWVSLGSCVLVLLICLAAAMLPYLRIRRVDPMMAVAVMTSPAVADAVRAETFFKTYGRGGAAVRVLDGVDLRVHRGQCVFSAGPSGSGKTTLLSILGCMLSADEGRVEILGRDVSNLNARECTAWRLRPDRLCLPAVPPDPRADGLRERGSAARAPRDGAAHAPPAGASVARIGRFGRQSPRPAVQSSAPANANAWPWPGPWPTIPT